eukprot:2479002-Pyramimonas_sp.AAC.1
MSGAFGPLLGRVGAVLKASEAVVERREVEQSYMPKMYGVPSEGDDFGLLGLCAEGCGSRFRRSGGFVGSWWKPPRRSGAVSGVSRCFAVPFQDALEAPGGSERRRGAFLGRRGSLLELSRAFLRRSRKRSG